MRAGLSYDFQFAIHSRDIVIVDRNLTVIYLREARFYEVVSMHLVRELIFSRTRGYYWRFTLSILIEQEFLGQCQRGIIVDNLSGPSEG